MEANPIGRRGDVIRVIEKFSGFQSALAKELLVFEALAGGPFAPTTEAAWFEGFPHVCDDLAFLQTRDFANFFEGDAVGPGGPNDPIGTVLGWLGLFNPGYGKFGLLGFHQMFEDLILVLLPGGANNRPSVVSKKY